MSTLTDAYVSLKEKLSPEAKIYLQDSESFVNAKLRWSQFKKPHFTVVVEVATEIDVAETVKYANSSNIPFLAFSGGHGAIAGLDRVKMVFKLA